MAAEFPDPNLEDQTVLLKVDRSGYLMYENHNFHFDHSETYQDKTSILRHKAMKSSYIVPYYLQELYDDQTSIIDPETAFEICKKDPQFVDIVAAYMRLKNVDEKMVSIIDRIKRVSIESQLKKKIQLRVLAFLELSSFDEVPDLLSEIMACINKFTVYAQILMHHYLTNLLTTGSVPEWISKEPYVTVISSLTGILEELEVSTIAKRSEVGADLDGQYGMILMRVKYTKDVICLRMHGLKIAE